MFVLLIGQLLGKGPNGGEENDCLRNLQGVFRDE